MSKFLHTVGVIAGADPGWSDHARLGAIFAQAYGAGGGAGQAVTAAVTGLKLPPNYAVLPSPGADVTVYVTNKTASGFTLNILPRLAANTVAAGSVDLVIVG
jgi:hypothetical protein